MNLRSAFAGTALFALTLSSSAQGVAPGPYEWLPFEDAFIVEAFTDLASSQIADWTGWTAGSWESPNAYNGHQGTDFSMPTGTPIYAAVSGVVSEVTNSIPENGGTGYGNYVKIQANGLSPRGEQLDVLTAHLLSTPMTVGTNVTAGQQIGLSDNTGNSTSEHCHVESSIRSPYATACAFYNAHYKYPIMFNPNMRVQVGHLVRVKVNQTSIRSDRFDSSSVITTAHQNQIYYASIAKRGYYRVFIPNNTTNRSGWIKAIDVEEVFSGGTVIQALPTAGAAYGHATHLSSTYPIRATADDGGTEIGRIYFGGGRFLADQTASGGWYRIPVPGASATWGWVKADNSMVVYPDLYHPSLNPANRHDMDLPHSNSFSTAGPVTWGRAKFDRGHVVSFAPADDGFACFLTDGINFGDGVHESISLGRPGDRNYFVECDVYFDFAPSYITSGWERLGIFIRDDGFGGLDASFEGKGNCYAMTWDTDDGYLRMCKIVDTTITDFNNPPQLYITSEGWHKMRIEAEDNTLRFYLDGDLKKTVTNETTFPSGLCGIAYSNHGNGPANQRGGYFDNFLAGSLGASAVDEWSLYE